MTFHEAKTIIRRALDAASTDKLCEILIVARQGRIPWGGAAESNLRSFSAMIADCGCLAQRLSGMVGVGDHSQWCQVSCAYYDLADYGNKPGDPARQRILVAMAKAAMRRRALPAEAPAEMEVLSAAR